MKSTTSENHAGSDKEQNGPGKWQKSGATGAKSVRWVEPSSLRSGSRLEPPHGFSEVADTANINGLGGGGWQKRGVAYQGVRLKIGYADPPYPGCAHLYKDHQDFGGEVDHVELIARLERDYDGWVLHTHTPAIAMLAPLVPAGARWGAWVKGFCAFKKHALPAYAWEPVIFKPCRKVASHFAGNFVMRDWVQCSIAMRSTVKGAKPEKLCHWAFEIIGATPTDELIDLYPGSGAVSRAWETWRPQMELVV